MEKGPIGVFDSGYGGLTVLKELVKALPDNDFLYLGDNARTPYGTRSFESVYEFTLQGVQYLFDQGCSLVILACNTASAKALRTIQQNDLPKIASDKRVLGVLRPTTESAGAFTKTGKLGLFGTNGTVKSNSYAIEIKKFFPKVDLFQQTCPMWVPLIENGELQGEGVDYFVQKYVQELIDQCSDIDAVLLACTHYPILKERLVGHLPTGIRLVSQGEIVAPKLVDYLNRHPEISEKCSITGEVRFMTTDDPVDFDKHSNVFYGQQVKSEHVHI